MHLCCFTLSTLIRVKTVEADERVIPEREREEAERRILIVGTKTGRSKRGHLGG